MSKEMESAHFSQRGHTTPEKVKELPWKVFRILNKTKIMVYTSDRADNSTRKQLPDLLAKGAYTMEFSTLKTFNERMKMLRDGDGFVPEVDELRSPDFEFNHDDQDVLE